MKRLQHKTLMSAADTLNGIIIHSSCNLQCWMIYCCFSIYSVKSKLAEAELNHNPFKKCHETWTVHPDGLWFSSATGGLHYTPEYHVPLRDPERFAVAFYVISVIRQTCSSKRQWETWDRNIEDTAHLGCRFPLIHLIHQRIYKACYLNAIFFTKTIIPFMNTAAHCRHIRTPIMCRVAPRKSMKRQYFIS